MSTRGSSERAGLLQGTLDLLILRTLGLGRQHGQGIARAIQDQSEARGWIDAEWGTSDSNRRARFYTLTRAGRAQLAAEAGQWRRFAAAVARVLGPEGAKG
jgi:PadR family transcriptional regulator